MDVKGQKELVFKVVWRSFLGVITAIAIINTVYYDITDTLVRVNFVAMAVISTAPLILATGLFLSGMYHAVSIFLKDTQNYIKNEPFGWFFLKPLLFSATEFLLGFGSLFLSLAFITSAEIFPDALLFFMDGIKLCFDNIPQMYLLSYMLSLPVAGMLLLQKKLI